MLTTLKQALSKACFGKGCASVRTLLLSLALFANTPSSVCPAQNALVLQSDFGVSDGAVAAMKGVAFSVDRKLQIFDLTHDVPPFNIWEASLRLWQTAPYWPPGTVFVSVVDPGVGTDRKSVVLKTKSGHYFVTPDNGTLTHVAEHMGVEAIREIDEAVNRRRDSEKSYTFHGRDVYAYTGARLASGVIDFSEVGGLLEPHVVSIPYTKATYENGVVSGGIPILDVRYGNVWTNIPRDIFRKLGVKNGEMCEVKVLRGNDLIYVEKLPFCKTFGEVGVGKPLLYLNSIDQVAIAINQGNFAESFGVSSGPGWEIRIQKESK